MDNLLEFAEQAVKNKFNVSAPVEKKAEAEAEKKSPHLALCHTDSPSANNRHKSLMLKSNDIGFVDLIKSEHEAAQFEAFCNTLTDSSVLLDLYNIVKSDKQLLKNIIKGNK
ncbi:hypothetical protein [Aeromonas salmonicida]